MQVVEKINEIKDLSHEIISRNQSYVDQGHGTYYNYEKVIGLLTQVIEEMDLARTPRPAELPDDMAWSETFWDGEAGPDPYVFDGSMSVEEFEKFQNNYFKGSKEEPADEEEGREKEMADKTFEKVREAALYFLDLHVAKYEADRKKGEDPYTARSSQTDLFYSLMFARQIDLITDEEASAYFEKIDMGYLNHKD